MTKNNELVKKIYHLESQIASLKRDNFQWCRGMEFGIKHGIKRIERLESALIEIAKEPCRKCHEMIASKALEKE